MGEIGFGFHVYWLRKKGGGLMDSKIVKGNTTGSVEEVYMERYDKGQFIGKGGRGGGSELEWLKKMKLFFHDLEKLQLHIYK